MEKNIEDFAVEAARREAQRQYQREWRAKNPDKVREKNRRYWEKKGREFLENLRNGEGHA